MFGNNAGLGTAELGRWLGVSHRVGQLMCYWIIAASGYPLSCTVVQRVTEIEKKTEEFQEKVKLFNHKVNFRMNRRSREEC